jgi:hypothetical protein
MPKHSPAPWRPGDTADSIVCDAPDLGPEDSDARRFYGGGVVAESVAPQNKPAIMAAPKALEACRLLVEHASGNIWRGSWAEFQDVLAAARFQDVLAAAREALEIAEEKT